MEIRERIVILLLCAIAFACPVLAGADGEPGIRFDVRPDTEDPLRANCRVIWEKASPYRY